MEASALQHASPVPALAGRSPLLRLQGDERLIALVRRGHHGAFEALVQRYQSRLLAFCRHMLGSTEDAEDVLQEVFTAAFNAICADDRPINARPWLYRIARNRCLNHLRRPSAHGQDSMDVFERDGGTTTAETVHKREEFRQIVADVGCLPETQRTALLLREIDALSYEQIAEAMDTTVPSVKSLLVRARVSLAEAAEARLLTCEEVRIELGEVAEGLAKTTPPVRRHLKGCERCRVFRTELRRANRALAAVYPIGPLILLKKLFVGKLGTGAAASGGAGTGGSSAGLAGGAAASGMSAGAAGGATAGGVFSAGVTTIASKAVAGVAAAAIVTGAAVEVKNVAESPATHASAPAALAAPQAARHAPPAVAIRDEGVAPIAEPGSDAAEEPQEATAATVSETPTTEDPAPSASTAGETSTEPSSSPSSTPASGSNSDTQEDGSTIVLGDDSGDGVGAGGGDDGGRPMAPPGEGSGTPADPQPAPLAGEVHGGQ